MILGISKRALVGGSVISGTGFATGVSGLTVMGMNESETDLISKKLKIESEKLKVQENINDLNREKDELEERKQNKPKREEAIDKFEKQLLNKIKELQNNLNNNHGCRELKLEDFLKNEDSSFDSIKDEEWFKKLEEEYKGSTQFGSGCEAKP